MRVSKGFCEDPANPGLVTVFPETADSRSNLGTLWAGPHFGVAFNNWRNLWKKKIKSYNLCILHWLALLQATVDNLFNVVVSICYCCTFPKQGLSPFMATPPLPIRTLQNVISWRSEPSLWHWPCKQHAKFFTWNAISRWCTIPPSLCTKCLAVQKLWDNACVCVCVCACVCVHACVCLCVCVHVFTEHHCCDCDFCESTIIIIIYYISATYMTYWNEVWLFYDWSLHSGLLCAGFCKIVCPLYVHAEGFVRLGEGLYRDYDDNCCYYYHSYETRLPITYLLHAMLDSVPQSALNTTLPYYKAWQTEKINPIKNTTVEGFRTNSG